MGHRRCTSGNCNALGRRGIGVAFWRMLLRVAVLADLVIAAFDADAALLGEISPLAARRGIPFLSTRSLRARSWPGFLGIEGGRTSSLAR